MTVGTMTAAALALVGAALAMVLLSFGVGVRLLAVRIGELRAKRIHPQALATAGQITALMEDTRASDNFRNLFETPVLFYALVATALATGFVPTWLAGGAWLYVALRLVHSVIQCGYNKVMHRFRVFMAGFALLTLLWVAFAASLLLAGVRSA